MLALRMQDSGISVEGRAGEGHIGCGLLRLGIRVEVLEFGIRV